MEMEVKIKEFLESEGATEAMIWDASEIQEVPSTLEPELRRDVPGMELAIVYGDPIALGDILDIQQGHDNIYGANGTCGETSIANICTIAGMKVTEPEVVAYAMENNLCQKGVDDPIWNGGATTISQQIAILKHFNLDAHCEIPSETADPERLAELIEGGYGILLCINYDYMYGRTPMEGTEDTARHAICLTGTVRHLDGTLAGFYVCDSDSWYQNEDAGRVFVPLERMNACYTNISEANAVITDKPIR